MHCTYCGSGIRQHGWPMPFQGAEGLRYGDGRIICVKCHQTAVKNEQQIRAIWQHVRVCFAELGLSIQWDRLPIRLEHQPQIERSGGADTVGYAETATNGRQIDSRVTMLYGMPAALAVETLAHEVGHVWCREHNVQFRPDPDDEEGFCNVLACFALRELGNQYDAPKRIEAMFQNPDPVYGGKFREQWQKSKQLGWLNYKAQLFI